MESILPMQITVLICGNGFNPVTPSQPFKSLLFLRITINSSVQQHEGEFVTDVSTLFTQANSLVKSDTDLNHAVAR